MKNFLTKSFLNPILIFAFLSISTGSDASWIKEFTAQTEKVSTSDNLPGYAFTVVNLDKKSTEPNVTFVTQGVTHLGGQAIDRNTVFRLASVSKTFTSVLTTKLVSQGQLKWELSLEKLIPNSGFKSNRAVTLQHILSQSSGYMPNAYDNLIEANYSVDRVLRQLAKLEPICSPGKCYTYQNALFAAVEQGVHHHTNKSFKSLLQEQLFKPLDMGRTSVGLKPLVEDKNWARPHVKVAKKQYKQTRVKPAYYRYAAASGINASIEDMSKWLKAMLGLNPDVISDKQISELIKPKTKTTKELRRRHWREHIKTAHYALGWRVYDFDGEKLVHHGGWVSGYRADITFAPEHGGWNGIFDERRV